MLKVQMLSFRNILGIYTHKLKLCKYAPFNDQTSKLQIRTSLRHYFSHPAKKTCQLIELTSMLPKVSSLLQESLERALPFLGHRRNPFALKVLSLPLQSISCRKVSKGKYISLVPPPSTIQMMKCSNNKRVIK